MNNSFFWFNTLIMSCWTLFTNAQQLRGNFYNNDGEYLKFKNKGNVEFMLWQNGGIRAKGIGEGTYRLKKNGKLEVMLSYGYIGNQNATYISLNQGSEGKIDFFVSDKEGNSICCKYIIYKLDNDIRYLETNAEGYASLKLSRMPDDSVITVSISHYEDCRIKLTTLSNITYKVKCPIGELEYKDIFDKKRYIYIRSHQDTIWYGFSKGNINTKLIKVY